MKSLTIYSHKEEQILIATGCTVDELKNKLGNLSLQYVIDKRLPILNDFYITQVSCDIDTQNK